MHTVEFCTAHCFIFLRKNVQTCLYIMEVTNGTLKKTCILAIAKLFTFIIHDVWDVAGMGHHGTLCAKLLPSLTSGHLTLQCEGALWW